MILRGSVFTVLGLWLRAALQAESEAVPGCAQRLLVGGGAQPAPRRLQFKEAQWGDHGFCGHDFSLDSVVHSSRDEPDNWVQAHNHYRSCHGVQPVIWDEELRNFAKAWVEQLLRHCDGIADISNWRLVGGSEAHRPHDPNSYEENPNNAENIAAYQSPFPILPVILQASLNQPEATSVENWYREVEVDCPGEGHANGCGDTMNHYTAMIWKSNRRIGCYSAILGGLKIVSCRYAPAEGDEVGCVLPNTVGCGDKEVVALTGGQCPPWGLPMAWRIPLFGPLGDTMKQVLEPAGLLKIGDVTGTWIGDMVPGKTVISQDGLKVVLTNRLRPWSPAQGQAGSGGFDLDSPEMVRGISGKLLNESTIKLSNGEVWHRTGEMPAVDSEARPEVVIGFPDVGPLRSALNDIFMGLTSYVEALINRTVAAPPADPEPEPDANTSPSPLPPCPEELPEQLYAVRSGFRFGSAALRPSAIAALAAGVVMVAVGVSTALLLVARRRSGAASAAGGSSRNVWILRGEDGEDVCEEEGEGYVTPFASLRSQHHSGGMSFVDMYRRP